MRPADVGVRLLLGFGAAVLVVVGAIVLFVVTDSDALRAVALVIEVLVVAGLLAVIYRLLTRTLEAGAVAPAAADRTLGLGERITEDRRRAAVVAALRDAHALERGGRRFAEGAVRQLRDVQGRDAAARAAADLFERQRARAAAAEQRTLERLRALGRRRKRLADDELLVGEWLYERLLAHSVLTNARHGYGLARLAEMSYAIVEHLAAAAGDEESRQLAAAERADAEALAEGWTAAWDVILDAFATQSGEDGRRATHELLDEAACMEQMRERLLAVTAAQGREAAFASGAEDAGIRRILDTIDRESGEAGEHLRRIDARMRELGHRRSRLHAWETFAAARATALSEHVRAYKLARDVRDVVASDELEVATYDLLERAARRAGDTATAELASALRAEAAGGSARGSAGLDGALEVALLAE
ncbi:MAG TPA: hypothetical protein VFT50_15715 [Baekduia sp.]|nr:hypothetical protein [Baekduia sp.]